MLILGAVPPPYLHRLEQAAAPQFDVVGCRTWSDTFTAIRTRPVDLAFIDPGLQGIPRTHEVGRINALFPSLPLVLYARLHASLAPVLLELGALGVRDVFIGGHDDDLERLRQVVGRESARAVSQVLVREVQEMLSGTPPELRWALERVLIAPREIRTVQELANHAQMDRRTCCRWFIRCGLPAPNRVLTLLRALYAHRLLLDPGYKIEDVAVKLGYAKSRSLGAATKRVFGMAPAQLRLSLSAADAVALIRERLFGTDEAEEPSTQLKAI